MALYLAAFGHVDLPDPDADLRRPRGRRGDTAVVRRPEPFASGSRQVRGA
jgi:hypothetical protein